MTSSNDKKINILSHFILKPLGNFSSSSDDLKSQLEEFLVFNNSNVKQEQPGDFVAFKDSIKNEESVDANSYAEEYDLNTEINQNNVAFDNELIDVKDNDYLGLFASQKSYSSKQESTSPLSSLNLRYKSELTSSNSDFAPNESLNAPSTSEQAPPLINSQFSIISSSPSQKNTIISDDEDIIISETSSDEDTVLEISDDKISCRQASPINFPPSPSSPIFEPFPLEVILNSVATQTIAYQNSISTQTNGEASNMLNSDFFNKLNTYRKILAKFQSLNFNLNLVFNEKRKARRLGISLKMHNEVRNWNRIEYIFNELHNLINGGVSTISKLNFINKFKSNKMILAKFQSLNLNLNLLFQQKRNERLDNTLNISNEERVWNRVQRIFNELYNLL